MLLYRAFILISLAIRYTHGTLKPEDIEPGWLTLATNPTLSQQGNQAGHEHAEQSHSHNLQLDDAARASPNIEIGANPSTSSLHSPGTTKYFKSPVTRAKMRAKWTEERRQKWGEMMRERNKKTPAFTAKGRTVTLETRKKISRKRKGMKTKPDTIIKISDALTRHYAAKRAKETVKGKDQKPKIQEE